MHEGDLEGSLLTVIGGTEGRDLLQEAAEYSLDALLDDGIVKDIPVVGTVPNLYGLAVRVQGYPAELDGYIGDLLVSAGLATIRGIPPFKGRTRRRRTDFLNSANSSCRSWSGARAAGSDRRR